MLQCSEDICNRLQWIVQKSRLKWLLLKWHYLRGGSKGGRLRRSSPLKPAKVTLFTMILNNSENIIRDIRPFCPDLFCHSSIVKYTSCLLEYSEAVMWLYCHILLKIAPSLTLLAGSATALPVSIAPLVFVSHGKSSRLVSTCCNLCENFWLFSDVV